MVWPSHPESITSIVNGAKKNVELIFKRKKCYIGRHKSTREWCIRIQIKEHVSWVYRKSILTEKW